VGQPVAEFVISSAMKSDWDWLLHSQLIGLFERQKPCHVRAGDGI
jgi:hypothetical protein